MGSSGGERFAELLRTDAPVLAPGATTPLLARLVEEAGFSAVYLTGAGVANMQLGVPDIGLLERGELATTARRIVEAVSIPVVADIDTGYGGIGNMRRTMAEFEAAGVAAVQIEDQVDPKRCGHFAGKSVVDLETMLQRVTAAVHSREDPNTHIIARTDSRAVDGFDDAVRRCKLLEQAGADLIFLEAPTSREELAAAPKEISVPLVANMVEGGRTPLMSLDELRELGYGLVIYANMPLRVATFAVKQALDVLKRDGETSALFDSMDTWERRQSLVKHEEWLAFEEGVVKAAEQYLS